MSAPYSERADEVRRRDRVVHDERQRVVVRDLGDQFDVEDVDLRVTDGLGEQQLRVGAHGRCPLGGVILIFDEGDLDAELRERVLEEVVRAAVDRRGRDDVVARARDVENRIRDGGRAGCDGERRGATLERGEALLNDVVGRVHDAGVDVAELGKGEQVLRVLGAVEDVRGRLVDRRRAGVGHRVGLRTGVDLLGFELPIGHGYLLDMD